MEKNGCPTVSHRGFGDDGDFFDDVHAKIRPAKMGILPTIFNEDVLEFTQPFFSGVPSGNVYISMERSTMLLMGKLTKFLWPCSIAIC